ncbi:MAG: tyrosine-type recombinase/integrase [Methanomassiliicoccaceae archaeon]|nr:tyrosine-type recombinase/integrase [Methanomassiliicoccaceae archaeon]
MSKYPQSVESCISKFYADDLAKDKTLSPRSVEGYRETAQGVFKLLSLSAPGILPHAIAQSDVRALLDYMAEEGYAVSTRKNYIGVLMRIMGFYGNFSIHEMKIVWPQDMRPNVDWLSFEDAQYLMDFPQTPNQEMLVNCELGMGFRRVEVARMGVQHVHDGYIDVVGKGRSGRKLRTVPFHPRTHDVVRRYREYRGGLIAAAQAVSRHPVSVPPPNMLVYRVKGDIRGYSRQAKLTGLDKIMEGLSEQAGFHFSHHTLRRTFGRIMYRSNVPIATIAKIYGHESTDTTLRYIGVDMDDMGAAMSMYRLK